MGRSPSAISCRSAIALVGIAALVFLGGCSSAQFYAQAVSGQLSLLSHRRPINEVLSDPTTPSLVQDKLKLTQEILVFAEKVGLPVGDTYQSYVDTGRDYVVWTVFAAAPYDVALQTFCYPVAGCVGYRGYFKQVDAVAFSNTLQAQGLDVYVGGVAAYSTLGWFDDPVLNTFLRRTDVQLAALLFHELAHKVAYVLGDTQFNESFATTVEREVLKQWLTARGDTTAFAAYQAAQQRDLAVIALIAQTRQSLGVLYGSNVDNAVKQAGKQRAIETLRARYGALEQSWQREGEGEVYSAFQYWMTSNINNAKLGTVATYNDWVPGFTKLLAKHHFDMAAFLVEVQALAEKNATARAAALNTPAVDTSPVALHTPP